MKRRATIQLALRTRLLTVAGLPAARQWDEYGRFDPPDPPTAYLRESFLPGPTRVDGLPAAFGMEVVDGTYLVDGFFPATADGYAAALAFSEAVTHAFRPGVPNGVLATGDADVRVDVFGAYDARTLPSGARVLMPLTVRWRSQVPNALTPQAA